jgi:hypothetical protein
MDKIFAFILGVVVGGITRYFYLLYCGLEYENIIHDKGGVKKNETSRK